MDPSATKPSNTHGELECTQCKETYKKPKMLRCMHTFCEECIQRMLCDDPSGMVICPICNYETMVGEDQELLWKNHIIQKKIDKEQLADMKANENEILYCTECETDVATHFCFDCKLKLCDVCCSHHKRCVRYNEHKVESIKDIPEDALLEPEVDTCDKHKQHMKYFCETCQISLCSDCALYKVHQNHSFRQMDEMMEEEMGLLIELISSAKLEGKAYEAYLNRVEKFVKTAAQKKECSTKVVEETFDTLINILQSEKDSLLRWLGMPYDSSIDALKWARDEVKILGVTTEYLGEILEYPKEKVAAVIFKGTKRLKDVTENMKKATGNKSKDSNNLYCINARYREIVSGGYLRIVESAMRQINPLKQKALPIRFEKVIVDQKQVFPRGILNEVRQSPQSYGCTHLLDKNHYLPPNVFLPHAINYCETAF